MRDVLMRDVLLQGNTEQATGVVLFGQGTSTGSVELPRLRGWRRASRQMPGLKPVR